MFSLKLWTKFLHIAFVCSYYTCDVVFICRYCTCYEHQYNTTTDPSVLYNDTILSDLLFSTKQCRAPDLARFSLTLFSVFSHPILGKMEDNFCGWPAQWKTSSINDDLHRRLSVSENYLGEDSLNQKWPLWKTIWLEDTLRGKRHQWKMFEISKTYSVVFQ